MSIANAQTISVDSGGSMSIGAATMYINNYNGGAYGLNVAGTLTTSGTSFTANYGGFANGSQVTVASGGHLVASNTNFAWDSVSFANGSTLNSGDLSGDTFQGVVYAPGTDVPLLAGSSGQANKSFQDVDVIAGYLPSGSLSFGLMGSASTAKLRYVFPSGYEVKSGATLAIPDNVSVYIQNGQTISVDSGGSMSIGAATMYINNYNGGAYGLNVAGTLTTSGTSFTANYGGFANGSQVTVASGGHLVASNTNFAWDSVSFANGSTLNSGDLSGDTFQGVVYAPGTDVPLLAGSSGQANKSFQDVDVIAGYLPSGSLSFGLMGSASTAKLRYVFPSGYEVKSGATLAIPDNVSVYIQNGQTISVDSGGSMSIGAATMYINNYNGGAYGLNVAGTLTTSGTSFTANYGGFANGSQVTVASGGHLVASNTNFAWDSVSFANGSTLNSGDLSGDTFQGVVYAPGTDVPLLAGSSGQANKSFQDVDVIAGYLPSGSLSFGLMGSASTAKLRYVFPSGYEVKSGATLAIPDNVSVYIQNGQTISVDSGGSMSIGAATMYINNYNGGAYGLNVAGTLTTSGTSFTANYGGFANGSQVTVASGGHLVASNTNFAWDSVSFANGSTLNSGDLSGDTFQGVVYAPGTDVPLLAGSSGQANKSFGTVNILAGSLNSGVVTLGLMGSTSTANLTYVFPSGYTVASGATLNVGSGVRVVIAGGQTITDSGAMNVSYSNLAFSLGGSPTQIVVNGTMTTTGASFTGTGGGTGGGNTAEIQVATGGHFSAIGSNFGLDILALNSGSTDAFHSDVLAHQIQINSGAGIAITGNDFSNLNNSNNGVIASGDPNATINLNNNYWGSTNTTLIAAKIKDHVTTSTLPTVSYSPDLSQAPSAITGLTFNDANANGFQDLGEPGYAGATLYLDSNNNGVLDAGEVTSTSIGNDPNNPTLIVAGNYRFDALAPGTYLVRETPPSGTVVSSPSQQAVTTTIGFDGTGGEAGVTASGVGSFTYGAASFSGGAIFAPSGTQGGLVASGTLAYNASAGTTEVDFSRPISSVTFFYVNGFGYAAGTATAYGYDGTLVGTTLGTAASKAATTMGASGNYVTMSYSQPIVRMTFSGGVIDNFGFTTQAGNQAYVVRLQAGQTVGGLTFGNTVSTGSATFVGTNTTTQGAWKKLAGYDGSLIANEVSSPPSYATVGVSGQLNFTWAASTTDPRALQKTPAGATDSIASCWYTDDTMTFDVNITDKQTHNVSMYALDWDGLQRSERIDVVDPSTGNVLNSQSISGFTGGEYLTWTLGGHVQIKVTRLGGMNAVVEGLFFGPAIVTGNSASFLASDANTQGNWIGAYGADGYQLAGGPALAPSYGSVTPGGASVYTWTSTSSDARALQVPNTTNRLAAAYYSSTSETFDVKITDGKAHQVAIYALDWDGSASSMRSETIQLIDDVNGAVLDTRTLTNYLNGVYLAWTVTGNVTIKATNNGGGHNNALVNGVFFGAPANTGNSVSFLKSDATTQGNWLNAYGADGYQIANGATSSPSYATVTSSGTTAFTWSSTTTDPRALQVPGSSSRLASTYYTGTSETFDVKVTDGKSHQVALYALDWDGNQGGRSETVQMIDDTSGAVLDSRTLTSFQNGVYLAWMVTGNVTIKVTNTGSNNNAVVSGLFFGAAPSTGNTASFVKTDTTTGGNWQGAYGADGYQIANGPTSAPSYASVTPGGTTAFTWSSTTTDPRALQVPGSSSRLASTYYTGTSETFDVKVTDGKSHQVALYALDWDGNQGGRSETVQMIDDTSGAVLDSRTLTSFQNGVYLAWMVTGNVTIKVINTGGASNNAVASGLFFG